MTEATSVVVSVASAVAVAVLLYLQSMNPTLLLYVFRPCKASTLTNTFLKTNFLYSWVLVGAFRFIAGSGSGKTSVFG